jgi:hypothetical protein
VQTEQTTIRTSQRLRQFFAHGNESDTVTPLFDDRIAVESNNFGGSWQQSMERADAT